MNEILSCRNLVKSFKSNEVLKDINLTLRRGEIYVLVGKNGAGKSTLFKILTGLMKATMGEIELLGKNILDYKNEYFKELGLNINEPKFYEHLTARENLEIHCDYMNCRKDKIRFSLENVGLSYSNKTITKNYSLGMKQRLSLARALIHEPKLLIIDEPLNGLDPKGIKDLRYLFKEIRKKGVTILMSSHILAEVEKIADRVGILNNGNLILEDTIENLLRVNGEKFEDYIIEKMEKNYEVY
ncbi:ABC transporter ATP-binding protein [Miniphocaeibacter halophilus]|uniref:ATP-binding cassette domain-containing protein n=1 Tax=Miniphocaeibacter halophilus TaxID=2931922 RepID=A0AC61MU90_9FIRM|nr:ATP-binding cassette domain-containing protein [Miniphocaeibacter halophilus]QQK08190.1 ATP-binding cassette domain-containing protein [Miniphocaeibacter halophilus]